MGPLSSLLNATDGLFGDLLDLRIIATTNAKKLDIDPALLRPGRLLKQLEFEKLSMEQSNQVLQRLCSEKSINSDSIKLFTKPQTLAEIYQHANQIQKI